MHLFSLDRKNDKIFSSSGTDIRRRFDGFGKMDMISVHFTNPEREGSIIYFAKSLMIIILIKMYFLYLIIMYGLAIYPF